MQDGVNPHILSMFKVNFSPDVALFMIYLFSNTAYNLAGIFVRVIFELST